MAPAMLLEKLPFLGVSVLGGFLTEYYSWRWIFFVNLPIGVIAIFAALRILACGGTPYVIATRLHVSGTTACTLAARCQGVPS